MASTKDRWQPKGALVAVAVNPGVTDPADAGWQTLGLSTDITPPGADSDTVDMTGLEDTFPIFSTSIENVDEISVQEIYDPNDSDAGLVETARQTGAAMSLRFSFRDIASTKTLYQMCDGVPKANRPDAVNRTTGLRREITFLRQSAVTTTVVADP